MNGNIAHAHCDPKELEVYHNVALTHLADVTQASSISMPGRKISSWRSLKTWWGFLRAWYHSQTSSDWVLAGEQQQELPKWDPAVFYIPMFKFMILRWRSSWEAWHIRNSNQLISGWMFHQIKGKTSSSRAHFKEQENPLRFQLSARSLQPLCGANVRRRPKFEPSSHKRSTGEPEG